LRREVRKRPAGAPGIGDDAGMKTADDARLALPDAVRGGALMLADTAPVTRG